MIVKKSRYEDAHLRVVPTSPETVMVKRRFPVSRARESHVVWKQGMRLDLLAARLFGNPDEWWRILDLNPHILSPTDLRPGMIVTVPDG